LQRSIFDLNLPLCLSARLVMPRTYHTGEVAKLLGVSRGHLTRLLKKGVLQEPSVRNAYGYRQWTEADLEQAQEVLARRELFKYKPRKTC